jgi:hypothetical protein
VISETELDRIGEVLSNALKNLANIDLSNAGIEELNAKLFLDFICLTKLNLNTNKLTDLNNQPF